MSAPPPPEPIMAVTFSRCQNEKAVFSGYHIEIIAHESIKVPQNQNETACECAIIGSVCPADSVFLPLSLL